MQRYVGETERRWKVRGKDSLAGKEDMLVFVMLLWGLQKVLQVEEAVMVGVWTEVIERGLVRSW